MPETTNMYIILVENPEMKSLLERLSLYGRIILKSITKYDMDV